MLVEYNSKEFNLTTDGVRITSPTVPKIGCGIHWLPRLLVGAFITTNMAERIRLFENKHFKGTCPCCKYAYDNTVDHFVFRCRNATLVSICDKLETRKSVTALMKVANIVFDPPQFSKINNTTHNSHYYMLSLLYGGTTPSLTPKNSLFGHEVKVGTNADIKDIIERIAVIPVNRHQMSLARIGTAL